MDPWPLSGLHQWASWNKSLYNSQLLDLLRKADLLYEWNMVGSVPCSVLRLYNAQQAVVNLVRSYPSQLKRYQALTWWMEDKSWEGYPFRQSWMTLTEPCVKAHSVFACTISHLLWASLANDIGGFPCMKPSPFFPSTSHPVGKMKETPKRQDAIMIWKFKFKYIVCLCSLLQQNLSAQFLFLLYGNR